MKVRYSPKIDAELQVAFTAQSCRAVGARAMAESGEKLWQQAAEQADAFGEKLFPEAVGDPSSAEALEQMIEYETYKATELYLLFAQEARHDGYPEIAEKFEKAAKTAEARVKALEELKKDL